MSEYQELIDRYARFSGKSLCNKLDGQIQSAHSEYTDILMAIELRFDALTARVAELEILASSMSREINALTTQHAQDVAEMARLREAIATLRKYAARAAVLNDNDHIPGNTIRAHKMLMALGGLRPKYDPVIDAALALAHPATEGEKA